MQYTGTNLICQLHTVIENFLLKKINIKSGVDKVLIFNVSA